MLNNPNLRLLRHYGVFGDGFCNCHICREKRLIQDRRKKIATKVSIGILIGMAVFIASCTLCHAYDGLQASYYSEASLKKEGTWKKSHGIMANGRVFNENALTCATRLYPLGSHLLVENLANGKSVVVVVTDRIGKRFAKTRIDLSKGAFLRLGSLQAGLIAVNVSLVKISVKKGA